MKLSDEQIQRLNDAGFKWCLEAKKKFEKERVHAVRGGAYENNETNKINQDRVVFWGWPL